MVSKEFIQVALAFYLLTTFMNGGGEFAHNHIYTLQSGLLQLLDLLFHYSLKGQVRGEEPRPVGISRRHRREERGGKGKEEYEKKKKKLDGRSKASKSFERESNTVGVGDMGKSEKQMARGKGNTEMMIDR